MKALFNVAAGFINVYTASFKAAVDGMRSEMYVVVPFIKELREGYEESNLPTAIRNFVKAYTSADNAPAWAAEAEKEVKLLQKAITKSLKGDGEAAKN